MIAIFDSKFKNNSNFTLETSVATDTSLLYADVLICDWSGIALEYAFGTERPVLFLDVPVKIHNQRYNELSIQPIEFLLRSKIGVVISPKKLETIPHGISKLMERRTYYKKRIAELRKKYVYAFGHSSNIGAQYISDILNRDSESHQNKQQKN